MNPGTKVAFRTSFRFPIYFMPDVFHKAFPMHMAKGMSAMRGKVNSCDCVIEIRDARVPMSSYNPEFNYLYATKPRVILMNKIDLANENTTKSLSRNIQNDYTSVIYTNCKVGFNKGVKKIMPFIKEMIFQRDAERANRKRENIEDLEERTYKVLVCGIPNVGKSSFINSARRHFSSRKGKATPVGKNPGVTRSVLQTILISLSPRVLILDTPGIIPPLTGDPITGIKLALTGTFPDHLIGEEVIADYLLYSLNQQNNTKYISMCGLSEPSDDFDHVISSLAEKNDFIRNSQPDYRRCSKLLISAFRDGKLGRITLD